MALRLNRHLSHFYRSTSTNSITSTSAGTSTSVSSNSGLRINTTIHLSRPLTSLPSPSLSLLSSSSSRSLFTSGNTRSIMSDRDSSPALIVNATEARSHNSSHNSGHGHTHGDSHGNSNSIKGNDSGSYSTDSNSNTKPSISTITSAYADLHHSSENASQPESLPTPAASLSSASPLSSLQSPARSSSSSSLSAKQRPLSHTPSSTVPFSPSSISSSRSFSSSNPMPRVLLVAGCSGSGKGTLIKLLRASFPGCFQFSVSSTTRSPRPGEVHGREYNFMQKREMEQHIKQGKFVEHANVYGNLYGTSYDAIGRVHESGAICLLEVDTQGVRSISKTELKPTYIFIRPPSLRTLEQRLRSRKTETEETLKRRLSAAERELVFAQQFPFHLTIVNDDLRTSFKHLVQHVTEHYPDLHANYIPPPSDLFSTPTPPSSL